MMLRFDLHRRQGILAVLMAAFIFASLHSAIHNDFDHHHDASCNVYVLEQLFVGTDDIPSILLPTLFVTFLFFTFFLPPYCHRLPRLVQSRAPPSLN